jgi:hypothetical protein
LMTQIFYFSIIYAYFIPIEFVWGSINMDWSWINYAWYPLNVLITFTIGTLWYKLENILIWEKVRSRDKRQFEIVAT